MNTKQVAQLDDAGHFVGLVVADESPLEPGVFLIPAGAVDAPVPVIPNGSRARWTGFSFAVEAIPTPEPEVKALAERRAAVWSQIRVERTRRENGGVQVAGHWFQTDVDSRIRFIRLDAKAAAALASGGTAATVLTVAGQDLHWKTAENGLVPMTAGLAQSIATAIENLDAAAFARGEVLREIVDASDDPELVDIDSGWPEILQA